MMEKRRVEKLLKTEQRLLKTERQLLKTGRRLLKTAAARLLKTVAARLLKTAHRLVPFLVLLASVVVVATLSE